MEWLMKLATQRADEKRERDLIKNGANEIWEALKFELEATALAYNRIYPPQNPGAEAQYQREAAGQPPKLKRMKHDAAGAVTEGDSVTVQFQEPAAILATYTNGASTLVMTVVKGKAGYATLQYDGDEITLDQACGKIAGALLFDDLKGQKS